MRVYQNFPGRNRFWCNGRLISGPDSGVFFVTNVLIIAPLVCFYVFVAPPLAAVATVAPVLLVAIETVIELGALWRAHLMDPGIVPRGPEDPRVMGGGHTVVVQPEPREVEIRGERIPLKYCATCHIYRQPRVSHCSICNNCVEKFDHHCPWVGNCVGLRNYRYFLTFVINTCVLCATVFLVCLAQLLAYSIPTKQNFFTVISSYPLSGALLVYTAIMGLSVGGLCSYHVWLTSVNLTTHENIREDYNRVFSEGCGRNWMNTCRKEQPGHIDFRASVDDENGQVRTSLTGDTATLSDTENSHRHRRTPSRRASNGGSPDRRARNGGASSGGADSAPDAQRRDSVSGNSFSGSEP